jgi:hypothetical protein
LDSARGAGRCGQIETGLLSVDCLNAISVHWDKLSSAVIEIGQC